MTMTTPASSTTTASTMAPLWTTAALFVGTVALSQVIQRVFERHEQKGRRMSYISGVFFGEQQHHAPPPSMTSRSASATTTTTRPRTSRALTRSSRSSQHHKRQQPLQQRQRAPSDASPYDFHPKNKNWSHFDLSHWNEEEVFALRKRRKSVDEPEPQHRDNGDTSDEQEEEFLWTSAKSMRNLYHEHSKRYYRRGSWEAVSGSEQDQGPDSKESSTGPSHSIGWMRTLQRKRSSVSVADSDAGDTSSHGVRDLLANPNNGSPFAGDEPDAVVAAKAVDTARERDDRNHALLLRRYTSNPERFPSDYSQASGEEMEIQWHNRNARAQYNSQIMPNKLVMIRHGQSMGNINEELYSKTPDNAMPLTKLGWEEACKAGKVLRERVLASGETVHFIVSPYVRTVETFHGLVSAWCDPHEFSHIENRDERLKAWYGRLLELGLTWHEDPRIREQDFGNYQDPTSIKAHKRERWRFGPFFYRFPHGESASDVFDRVSTFLDSLWRSFDLNRSRNYVLVTHGISIRVLLARYFRYSIDQFNVLSNPRNCEMVILGHDGQGRLQLNGRCEMEYEETESGEKKTAGYSFHKRLRVLPRQWVKKVKIRISYDDDDDGEG